MRTNKRIAQYIIITIIIFNIATTLNAQNKKRPKPPKPQGYSIEQATSERAQLHTIAFSGLAFITGSFEADTFFPPGKVADYFGFQYMRDNDKNKKGHSSDFLTQIANNVIDILNDDQLNKLKQLANKQATLYDNFAKKRFILIKAFRDNMEGNIPSGKNELSKKEVIRFCSELFELDAELSYNRALVVGNVINSFTDKQKSDLEKLDFSNSSTWPSLPEKLDKRSMSHRAHVGVMTYASELFSWYAGSVKADTYFCPERHGTYFGSFYLKAYPAMGKPNYIIKTALTGDKGRDFLTILSHEQKDCLENIIIVQTPLLKNIVEIREKISIELRKAVNNKIPNKEIVFSLVKQYGELEGEMAYLYASCFAKINHSLVSLQRNQLYEIRNQNVLPKESFLFSDPINRSSDIKCGFLFK